MSESENTEARFVFDVRSLYCFSLIDKSDHVTPLRNSLSIPVQQNIKQAYVTPVLTRWRKTSWGISHLQLLASSEEMIDVWVHVLGICIIMMLQVQGHRRSLILAPIESAHSRGLLPIGR